MFRFLNIIAVVVLVGSAVYAYEIKYSTLFQAEQLAKAKRDLSRETDRVAMLKAEWTNAASPERIEALAGKYLGGQTLQLTQIVAASAVPEKQARGDEIGAKLSDLGLGAPTHTPGGGGGATPASAAPAKPKGGAVAAPSKAGKGAAVATPSKGGKGVAVAKLPKGGKGVAGATPSKVGKGVAVATPSKAGKDVALATPSKAER